MALYLLQGFFGFVSRFLSLDSLYLLHRFLFFFARKILKNSLGVGWHGTTTRD